MVYSNHLLRRVYFAIHGKKMCKEIILVAKRRVLAADLEKLTTINLMLTTKVIDLCISLS